MKKNKSRTNTIETIITLIKNKNIIYYDKTGFYDDDNVVWSVWDHVDELNPWEDIKHNRNKDKIYIDLYHNPINGCKLYNGMKIEGKYPGVKDFKGDISCFGDIHLRQFFKNKTKAYSSSLIQQNFGELPENHGYLLWDIENHNVFEKNIDNDYKFINIPINKDTDYDKLIINSDIKKSDKIKVKIKWEDYSVNMNVENEKKLRDTVKNKIGSENIKIETIPLYVDILDSKLLSETININDKNIQQNLLKEFLSINKINKNQISKIIDIDDIINSRLNLNIKKNIQWDIEKIWFNNFKSYGDNNIINWKNKNGIIQIHGLNQQGKSTILDVISYILYGTTMSTIKREKNGDNRYINNNRDKDYCDGGVIINVDGEKYLIYRKTQRKYKKDNQILSCTTKLDYYKGDEIIEENKLDGEKRIDTQKELDSILGDFNDFIRITFTSADNINDILSMDRSVFIDNIIKDAGYDIFEKKLLEFKEYKKELNLEKINLNLNESENEILNIKNNIEDNKIIINNFINEIKNLEYGLIKKDNEKENLMKSLYNIDNNIMNINYEIMNEKIINDGKFIINENEKIIEIKKILNDYPTSFQDKEKKLNEKKLSLNEINNKVNEIKNEIYNYEKNILNNDNSINKLNSLLENEKNNLIMDLKNNINIVKSDILLIENDIKILKKDGNEIKNKIDSYKEIKICPLCLKPLTNDDNDHFEKLIIDNKKELNEISIKGKEKLNKYKLLKEKLESFNKFDIKDKIKTLNIEITDKILLLKTNNQDIEKLIINKKENIKEIEDNLSILKIEIQELELMKDRYNERLLLESNVKDIKFNILNKTNEKKSNEILIEEYLKNKNFIIENKKILNDIEEIKINIETIKSQIKEYNNKIIEINQKILIDKKSIEYLTDKINKYKIQEDLNFILNTYLKSIHRDGLPTYLLKKSIHIINNELNMLLSDVDFNLLFDEDLNLKMKSKLLNKSYNAVEGSGMERTFNSCALKMSLRKINNTSKPNFILFDEIMNKLVGESVENFINLIYKLKENVDKIILIEHIHQLQYDYLIDVNKNKDGISSFDFY
jgi:hypothetical protein